MSTTTAPNKVILTCTVTGKTVTWTNRSIIQKKIDQFGSLEAFQAQFKCRGAGKPAKKKEPSIVAIKPILQQGIALGKMTSKEYSDQYPIGRYYTRKYANKDGSYCTVIAPAIG